MKPIASLMLIGVCFYLPNLVFAQDKVWNAVSAKKTQAQKQVQHKKKEAKAKLQQWKNWGTDTNYHHAVYASGRLHTNGWNAGIHYHFHRRERTENILRLQVAEIRHEKETCQQRKDTLYRTLAPYTPYILGKQYKVYTAQLGIGRQWIIFPSLLQGNISLKAGLEAGLSMALLKPVYLKLLRFDDQQQAYASSEAYSEQNMEQFLSPNRILGADRWSKGLKELRCIPGVYISPSVIFAPDRPANFVQQFEIGGQLAWYTRDIPLLLQNKSMPWQASFLWVSVWVSVGKTDYPYIFKSTVVTTFFLLKLMVLTR